MGCVASFSSSGLLGGSGKAFVMLRVWSSFAEWNEPSLLLPSLDSGLPITTSSTCVCVSGRIAFGGEAFGV